MMLNSWRFGVAGSLAAVAFFLAGCSSNDGPAMYPVSGTVTFEGENVEEGHIIFTPVEQGLGPDAGFIKDGRFSFMAKDGDKKVSIQATREVPGKLTSDFAGGEVPLIESYIPAKYNKNTTLEATVGASASENRYEFDLTKDENEPPKDVPPK